MKVISLKKFVAIIVITAVILLFVGIIVLNSAAI